MTMAKLNILIVNDGVFFHDVNSRVCKTHVVHCMNRTLFTGMIMPLGAGNPHLSRALRESMGSFHTTVLEAESLYDYIMARDPVVESFKPGRESLVDANHPFNIGDGPLRFDIQWANRDNKVIAKSLFDPYNAVAWYSYESTTGGSEDLLNNLFTGVTWPTIESEIIEGLESPIFLDLFNREDGAMAAMAGFQAAGRSRTGLTHPTQPKPASPYLTDRPLKDIKDILSQLGMNDNDAVTLAGNLGKAGLSTGSEIHNSIIRDIRGMLINKLK